MYTNYFSVGSDTYYKCSTLLADNRKDSGVLRVKLKKYDLQLGRLKEEK
jgi:hypothetical protein